MQAEIADELGVSKRQVYRSLKDARLRLGARTNHELVARAVADGLVEVREEVVLSQPERP